MIEALADFKWERTMGMLSLRVAELEDSERGLQEELARVNKRIVELEAQCETLRKVARAESETELEGHLLPASWVWAATGRAIIAEREAHELRTALDRVRTYRDAHMFVESDWYKGLTKAIEGK